MARFPKNDIISLVGAAPRYDLAESVGPDLHLNELVRESELGDIALAYGTAAGDPRLRQAIAAAHGVDADDVVITVGGMHALFLTAFILCERGAPAVTTTPLFPLARTALEAVGAWVSTLPLAFDNGYQPDLGELRRLLTPQTRLVSLATPQNPSGVAIPHTTIEDILALMAEICPEAHLLVDETYRDAVYGDNEPAASAIDLSRQVISCASLSKCHGAPGLRLGWAITRDPGLREQLVVGKFSTVIACSAVDEALALKVLEQRQPIIGARRRQLADGLARTEAWVREHRDLVDWLRPDAGALCCVRLKPAMFDDAAVTRFYESLPAHGVRVGTGLWFGEAARVFRLGFGLLPMPELDAALRGLGAAVRQAVRQAA